MPPPGTPATVIPVGPLSVVTPRARGGRGCAGRADRCGGAPSAAQKRIPPASAALPDHVIPTVFGERTVNQPPELRLLKAELVRHESGEAVINLTGAMRDPG